MDNVTNKTSHSGPQKIGMTLWLTLCVTVNHGKDIASVYHVFVSSEREWGLTYTAFLAL